MESDVPPTEPVTPIAPTPPVPESAHDRHMRELEQSVDKLEVTVEHWFVRVLKIAIPAVVGLTLAALASYRLGDYLRDRSEQKSVDRAIRRERSKRGRRALVVPLDAA
jgi:hypothetical protein